MRSAAPPARKTSRIHPATSGGSWVAASVLGFAGVTWGAPCGACWEPAGGAAVEPSGGDTGAVGVDCSLDGTPLDADEVEGSIGETAVVLELPDEP